MAEIVRRMEDRKAAKKLEASRLSRKEKRSVENVVNVSHGKNKRVASDVAKPADKVVADSQRATKKVSTARTGTTVSHTTQQEAARCWAAEVTSDTSKVTQSTMDKNSTRPRAAKKTEEAKSTRAKKTLESLEVQNFIAAQYPPSMKGCHPR